MGSLFFSYSHADEELRDELEEHLAMLKRQDRISVWHDRRIRAGDDIDTSISDELESASIILLLVSSSFLASEYCYGVEMERAMERHKKTEATVIPIVLRPCDWHSAPFGRLMAAPTDGKPVTKWSNRDEAWLSVVEAIKAVLPPVEPQGKQSIASSLPISAAMAPRSSNLRIKKEFTDADRDRFLKASFEFCSRFFENSLTELKVRNADIDIDFTRIDALSFTASIYRHGKRLSQCRIRLNVSDRSFGHGISFSYDESGGGNSYNECLSAACDDQSMYLTSFGMFHGGDGKERLSEGGGAELYWKMLMERVQ